MAEPTAPTAVTAYVAPSGAQYASTDGRVWLTKGGKFYSATPDALDDVYGQLGEGARPATADEVAMRLRERASDTVEGRIATVIENVGTGAISAAAAPARGIALLAGDDELAKTFTGESFAKDLAELVEYKSSGDLNKAVKAGQEWNREVQARRNLFPTLSAASQIAGEAGQVIATGGLSAAPGLVAGRSLPGALARAGAAAGAENALLSTGQETGAAVIENRDIDRERLAADGLSAAIFGAALGAGGVALGRGAERVRKALQRSSVDTAGEAARAAEVAKGAPLTAEESLEAAKAAGADAVDAAGVNPVARAEAAAAHAEEVAAKSAAVDPSDWRATVRDTDALALYPHRDAVLDGATRDAADDLNKVLERQRPVYDEIDNFASKREKVAEHLAADNVDETALLQRVQDDAAAIRGRLDEARDALAAQRAENIAIPEAAKKAKPGGADVALNRADFIIRRAEKALAKAESGADGVIAVDQMRRELAKLAKQTKQAFRQTQGLEERMALEPVSDFLQKEYLSAADSLMDASVVGARQAAAQSAVNRARVDSIASGKHDLRSFLVRVGDDNAEDFGRTAFQANRDSIRSLLAEIQPGPAARLKTEQFERFLENETKALAAIRDNYAMSPANTKRLNEALESMARLRSTLDSARGAAAKVNEARALMDADAIGGGRVAQMLTGAAVGSVEGGFGGMLRGAARGALGGTGEVMALRQRMAALAESHDSRIAESVTKLVDKLIGGKKVGAAATAASGKKVRKFLSDETRGAFARAIPEEKTMLGGALALSPALRKFMSAAGETRAEKREQLQERRQQLAELISNPARVHRAAEVVLGQSGQYMPGMAAQMVAETMQRLVKMHERLGGQSQPSLLPNVKRPEMVSDQELRAQDALVQATLNPMSVFTDFAQGKVDPVKTAMVREMYPQIWAQAQAATVDALSRVTTMPSRQAMTQLDLFLGFGGALDASLRPDFLARQVERSKLAEAQDRPAAPSARRPPDIASKFATTSQRLGNS